MKTSTYPDNNTARDQHNNLLTCITFGEKSSKLPSGVNLTDRSWPFIGSFILHCLLFTIIIIPALQYPAASNTDNLTLFWLPSFISPGDATEKVLTFHRPSVAFAGQRAPEESSDVDSSEEQDMETQPSPPLSTVPETNAPGSNVPVDAVLTLSKPLPVNRSAVSKTAPVPTASPVRSAPLTVATAANKSALPSEPEPETQRVATQSLPPKLLELPVSGQTHPPENKTVQQNKTIQNESVQKSVEPIDQKQSERKVSQQEIEVKENTLRSRSIESNPDKKPENRPLAPVAKNLAKLVPKVTEKPHTDQRPVQQSSKAREVVPPIIVGDLKLVAMGTAQLTATITFKEFAPLRRSRPFSRSEEQRGIKIIPQIVKTANNTVEMVIEQARAGVYIFTVEPTPGATDVVFSLKLYDGTSRKIIKELGKKNLAQKSVLCKVLMPEGILWDDNKSFTGSMEDSESVTKFNTANGLMWKEYTD